MLECLESAVVNLPDEMPHQSRFNEWLKRGFHANMKWMENNAEFDRKGYNAAWIALWKYPKPLSKEHEPIAAYAHGEDYHITLKKTLREMAEKINGYPFVDSSPVPERELAALAGLGFIGKNTMLINPKFGSAFFIGGYLFNCQNPDSQDSRIFPIFNYQLKEKCKNCRKCIDACPNGALTEDGFLNANKCASYLTIEHRGEFTEEQKKYAKHAIFGCDICQRVCPYNKKHLDSLNDSLRLGAVAGTEIINWTKSKIKNTPMFRTGVKNLKRNTENFNSNY